MVLLSWLFLLTYPVPLLFKISPKFAYAAQYSPVYQVFPYQNYPAHINALAAWIKEFTPKNSIIIVPDLNPYQFYYYAKRDIIKFSNLKQDVLKLIISDRPVYLVEDHYSLYNPSGFDELKNLIKSAGLDYASAGEVKMFSPHVGHTTMHIYRITS